MSAKRHPSLRVGALVVGAFPLVDRAGFPVHEHPTHQLAWATTGVLTMGVADRTWVLPRSRALWIPARTPHDVLAGGETTMVSLYFDVASCPLRFDRPTVIDTSGLLGHLIEHLLGDLEPSARHRAEAVVFDLVQPLEATSLHVPTLVDERAAEVAAALEADPADGRTLGEWGRAVGASGRTLARAFERDTGMGFADWRTAVRIKAALARLAAGVPVHRVALDVGYASPSAFVAAFRRTTGATPGQYFDVPATGRS